MEQLEYYFEKKIKKFPFIERKVKIKNNKNILLTGVKRCGKTFLIKDYLYDKKNYLYIDFEDIRIDKDSINKNLQKFIDKNSVEIVALDNYDKSIIIPKANQIILSSLDNIDLDNFEKIRLSPLDFEEYIAFDKSVDVKIVFNNFLKNGTLPEISQINEYKKEERFFEILRLTFLNDELKIFKEIANFQGHKGSAYHIFTKLKSKIKISKDRFYKIFEELRSKGYFYTLEKFGHPNASKKIYLYDFAIKNYLSFTKEFPKIFENLTFLELREKKLYYIEPIGFYLPEDKKVILPIPFGNEVRIQNQIEKVLKRNRLDIEKIEVITVGSSFKYEIDNIYCEISPFYEWALSKFE